MFRFRYLIPFVATALCQGQAPQFQRDIAPIFEKSCATCHLSAAMGKLRLDSEASILRGGTSGPAVVPGHADDSLLIKRIMGLGGLQKMPMSGQPLTSAEVALIKQWIDTAHFETAATQPTTGSSTVFAKEVRPILAARCYSCHGADMQQSGLRLDTLSSLLKGSDYGPIVVPQQPDKSRLMRRLLAQERPQMPYGGPPLSSQEVATISKWIASGAQGPDDSTPVAQTKTQKHWAYVKPVRPATPAVQGAKWVRNPIDAFILARLDKEGLKPSPEASKSTLLRRVYLDLTGLPPTPQEIEAFLNDNRPDAYEHIVDTLLASPHYGEKWARLWLDLARYADSNGYEKDRRRTIWQYRDWVIRALNADMSFRDFTIDQIAGDMLPNPTQDQLIATGFNRNSMLNQEGGIDVNEYYYYSLVDRVNTTSSVWLGSTLGCAQCHNHKFDPFPQKDYYRFLAFFSNGSHFVEGEGDHWMMEQALSLPTTEQEKKSKELKVQIEALQQKLATPTPELEKAQTSWEQAMRQTLGLWTIAKPSTMKSLGGATMQPQADGSILVTGSNPQADTYVLEVPLTQSGVTGLRLEVLPDATLPHQGPGRDPAGNFFLSDFQVESVTWKSATSDENQDGYGAKNLAAKKPGVLSGWAIKEDSPAIPRQAIFIPSAPITANKLVITMKHEMRHSSRNIGHFRISVTKASDPSFVAKIPAALRPVLDVAPAQRTPDQKEQLAKAYRSVSPLLDDTRKQIADLQKQFSALGIVTTMVMSEQPTFARPAAYLRERGTFTSPGELVYADVPGALNPLPKDAMPNRLGLAQWLVSDDNPLTARVTVNRYWETIFGRGLVETSEDFGTQGDLPSHPELLDWLATEFMQNGWSPKKLQRLLVTSATYRQDSRVTPDLISRDPYNKLYAHGPRFRVDAETVHDLALADSGLLSDKMFGPPVFPYQPEGVWDIPYSDDKWVESSAEDKHRRAIYTMIRRSAPYPSMITYDSPSREFCTVRRVRTNTPLQALTSLNDPYFFDAARAMAKRIVSEGGSTTPQRIRYGFLLTIARPPTQSEVERITAFYEKQQDEFSHSSDSATKVVGQPAKNAAEMAAWTMVSNVLLNADEAITKE